MIYMFLLTIPFSLYEPSIEPHLTAPPFDLTPGHVGNVFGVAGFADVIGAVSAGVHALLQALISSCRMLFVDVSPHT